VWCFPSRDARFRPLKRREQVCGIIWVGPDEEIDIFGRAGKSVNGESVGSDEEKLNVLV
jgi:hypothetical protein